MDTAGEVFLDPERSADDQLFYESCAVLRAADPVRWMTSPAFRPFWLVTKHSDVVEIESRRDIFLNGPRPILAPAAEDELREKNGDPLRTLIHLDGLEHQQLRAVGQNWFSPTALARLDHELEQLAKTMVDTMARRGSRCDFVADVATRMPLEAILLVLGLTQDSYETIRRLTQDLFGGTSDENPNADARPEDFFASVAEFMKFFSDLAAQRRKAPTDDFASTVANAVIDGRPISDQETLSYFVLIATAGHDTTATAIAGGLRALADHPDQLRKLREQPQLMSTAVEEMLRWVSPVRHFMRTATCDYSLRGRTIRAGDAVLLSYPSANHDEDVFAEPNRFDIGRAPNRHLGFGFGVHYCLGAHLARREMKALFGCLLPRLSRLEVAPAAIRRSSFVAAFKRLPITYELAPVQEL